METAHKCEKCTVVPEILREQLELLSEKSKDKNISVYELVALSEAMDKLISKYHTARSLPCRAARNSNQG